MRFLWSTYYHDGAARPVPEYLLESALAAAFAVVMERGRAGLATHWECLGTFYPYTRPGRVIPYKVKKVLPVWPWAKYTKEYKTLPDERWLYFRSVKLSPEFEQFYLWDIAYESSYTGGESGKYRPGRAEVWRAVRAELSKVTKGAEWGKWFVHGADGLEASPDFVNGFFIRVAVLVAWGAQLGAREFGEVVRGRGGYVRLVHPVLKVPQNKWVLKEFRYQRTKGAALGLGE